MAAGHSSVTELVYPIINFTILVALLFYFLKKPVTAFVSNRHTSLKQELEDAQKKLAEAQKQYQEYAQRLSTMDAEVSTMVQQIRSEAEAARVKIVTEAKRMADEIVIDSKRTSESLIEEFKERVRTDLADQVILRAEAHLKARTTGDVRERLMKDFSKQVESAQ
jgi:F-type H+-transporting ATPase subunit b